MSTIEDVQAGGPRLYFAPYAHPLPDFYPVEAGSSIDWQQNQAYSLTITGSPTGGTFAITVVVDGVSATTSGLAYNANAAAIQTAIRALSNVGSGNANVTGSGPFAIEFVSGLANTPVTLTADGALLTGGTSPAASVSTTAAGYNYTEALIAVDDVKVAMKEESEDFTPVYEQWRHGDVVTKQGVDTVKFTVAHRDIDTFKYSLGAVTASSVAATGSTVAVDILSPSGDVAPTYYKMVALLTAPSGGFYLLSFNKIRFTGERELSFGHGMTKHEVSAKCFKPSADADVWDFIEHTDDFS
jgi:hypothetical protein